MDFRVMNATSQPLDYIEKNCADWIVEPKFDGDRRMLHLRIVGNAPCNKLYGRRVSVVTKVLVEKSHNVPHLRNLHHKFPDTILDGEALIGDVYTCTSNQVAKIMGCTPEKAIERQKDDLQIYYVVFDCLKFCGRSLVDLPLKERQEYAKRIVSEIDSPHIKWVGKYSGKKTGAIEAFDHILSKGGEGVMVKDPAGKYVMDKRPRHNWYKVKKEATYDVVITGFQDAETETVKKGDSQLSKSKYAGQVGSITFGLFNEKGKIVPSGRMSGFDDALRLKMTKNPKKYIGKIIEVRCNDVTEKGKLRHPRFLRFREDKTADYVGCGTWQLIKEEK